ncbi:MAG: translational GTPase TypA [Candidatus Moraniibacteriota bacterium]|nr:MAG: translational GTPase TypA [Candidatus Moranbacteria bacterium]
MEIRNIAIIAHVDHGKTTLTDALMRQTGMTEEGASMDSNALEQERGITIYSKNAALFYKDTKINIVDTPGHADFGSEVERVLRSIDSVLLVVDAQEGPMPQTRFVLKKSLELGLKPIVVVNKIDKPAARVEWVLDQVFELFLDLGATDEQLDFKTVYAIAKQGIAKRNMTDDSNDLSPLLDTVLEAVPAAAQDTTSPFRAQPFNLGYDNFLGRLAICRVYEGSAKVGDTVFAKKPTGEVSSGRITKIFTFRGMNREESPEVSAGDIALIAGIADVYIGDTIAHTKEADNLPSIAIDEPTITLHFLVNDSPFAGREGKFVTREQLRERLRRELEINVGLKIDFDSSENFVVSGRGELHIAILLETMRREGYECQVSQPKVIMKEIDGKKCEPFEEVTVDVPTEYSGAVIERMGKRKGIMADMKQGQGNDSRLLFEIPTRGLLGYRGQFTVDTKGEGILSSRFLEFRPHVGDIEHRSVGSMISMATGKALGFSLWNLQERGTLYIGAGTDVYEGQVIGNASKGDDMSVNPTKGKQLTNMRASGSDDAIQLTPAWTLSIERGLEVMASDEYLEITPESVRLRKQYLTENDRVKAGRKGK